jgi:hypothetical protein
VNRLRREAFVVAWVRDDVRRDPAREVQCLCGGQLPQVSVDPSCVEGVPGTDRVDGLLDRPRGDVVAAAGDVGDASRAPAFDDDGPRPRLRQSRRCLVHVVSAGDQPRLGFVAQQVINEGQHQP